MIKDPKRYREHSERERAKFLRGLTYRQSARLLEALISSRLVLELRFAEDDAPRALSRHTHAKR
jgi:hypothetical protein